MDALLSVTDALVFALYAALGLACLRLWFRERGRAAAWAAAAFGLLGGTIALAQVTPGPDSGRPGLWLTKLIVVGLALFPYVLYRFTTVFAPAGRQLERAAVGLTAVLVLWTVALPDIPNEDAGENRSPGFEAFLLVFALHWVFFSTIAAARLWRAGSGQPTVVRRRMRLLAVAAITLAAALVVAAVGVDAEEAQIAVNGLSAATALVFVAGLVPPDSLRQLWRRPEQERLREAVVGLMRGQTREEIVQAFLPFVGPVVGAYAAEVVDIDGRTIARWGALPEGSGRDGLRRLALPLASVQLAVWSAPQTPFFGRDELELLRSTGTVLELALERADLLQRERGTIERLEELDDLKNTFLAAVSHELRTPLAVILGGAMTLEARRADLREEDAEALLRSLSHAARKLDRLLADLLDLDRLTRGVVAVQRQRTDLAELVRRVVAELGHDGRRVAVEANGVVLADVDPAKTERIVENLVANAVRHTPREAEVWVRTRAEDGAALLEVDDDGPGVPPELREAIFEPFRRGSAQHAPGTGIGLTLVRRFADLHGGSAWVEERPGGGARFCVRLPYEPGSISTR